MFVGVHFELFLFFRPFQSIHIVGFNIYLRTKCIESNKKQRFMAQKSLTPTKVCLEMANGQNFISRISRWEMFSTRFRHFFTNIPTRFELAQNLSDWCLIHTSSVSERSQVGQSNSTFYGKVSEIRWNQFSAGNLRKISFCPFIFFAFVLIVQSIIFYERHDEFRV